MVKIWNLSFDSNNTNKINFDSYSSSDILSEPWIETKNLKLSEIEPFEKNVRKDYDPDDMELLKQSILSRSDIWNIDVFHILDWDRYIISDWHRTYKAYLDLYWPDYSIVVVIRWKEQSLTPEVEKKMMEIWFVTSNTKKNLWFFEEISSIQKYIEHLDFTYPDQAKHKISQSKVYSSLWISKSKAMKYNSILSKFSIDELELLWKHWVSYKVILELTKIELDWLLELVFHKISQWKIKTTWDLSNFLKEVEDKYQDYEDVQNELSSRKNSDVYVKKTKWELIYAHIKKASESIWSSKKITDAEKDKIYNAFNELSVLLENLRNNTNL